MTRLISTLLLACLSASAVAGAPAHRFAQPPSGVDPGAGALQPPIDFAPVALDRATVRAALSRARARNLAAFRAYQHRGVFPSNTFSDGKLNVWRDADGHLCAAATIIDASGQHDLVARTAEQSNFIRLADVTSGPLMDWILTSGFTQAEIAAIQEPYMPVVDRPAPEPQPRPATNRRLRTAEDARLRAKYTSVESSLVKNEQQSLELAVDRLMARPQLAWSLIAAA